MQNLEDLLLQNIPRHFVLAAKDALADADQQANRECLSYQTSIRATQTGFAKHGRSNEAWHSALLAAGGNPNPLKSNDIVVGQFGIFKLARINSRYYDWFHTKKLGKKHTEIAQLNREILAEYVISDFFKKEEEITVATAFFVGVINGLDSSGQPTITDIQLCVPHPELEGKLYTKSLTEFLMLYDRPAPQIDLAHTTLKKQSKKQNGNDQGHQ